MSNYVRIDRTTITEHIRKETNNILRNRPLLALLQNRNRITYGHAGKDMDWRVKYTRNELNQYGDGELLKFNRINRHKVATLPWRGYVMSESVTKKERLQNKNEEAIIRIVADLTDSMLSDFNEHFEDEFYNDGNAAGKEEAIHGFASFLGDDGAAAQYTAPSDTYAGLSTVLGNYGGSILSGSWPAGKFDAAYDFWSPLIVNYTHADWAAAATWAASAVEVLRAGITHTSKNNSLDGTMDLIEMTLDMFREFKELVDDKERIQVRRDGEASGLVSLGFRDTINFDGVDCHGSYSVPDTQAYGLNIDSMELCSLQDDLFVPGEDYDITHLADQYTLDFFGNLKCNPRDMCLWDDKT